MKVGTALLAALSLTAACTSARPIDHSDRVLIAGAGESSMTDRQNAVSENVVYPSPPVLILPIIRSVYEDLGIEVKLFDPTTGEVGNRSFLKMYRLAGQPMSRYVGCGTSAAGSAADNYRITMNIVSRVTPSGEGSRISTRLTATADDVGSSKGSLACESLGALEVKIHEAVAAKLKAAQ